MTRSPLAARLHDSRLGAVPADADRRADGRPADRGLSGPARSAGAGARDALSADAARLPARARAFLDVLETAMPRSCRASCRSATSTRTRLAFAEAATGEARARARSAGSVGGLERAAAACALILKWADAAQAAATAKCAAGRQHPGRRAGARRRSGAADGRHDDAAGAVGPARRAGAGRSRQLLAAHARFPEDRPRVLAGRCSTEHGRIEPAERRDLLIEAESEAAATATTAR